MNLSKDKRMELELEQIAEDNRALQRAIDRALQGMQAAEAALQATRRDSLKLAAAIRQMPSRQSTLDGSSHIGAESDADSEAREAVSVIANIETFSDFALAVISAWQGNSWGVINRYPLQYGIFGFQGKWLKQLLEHYFRRSGESRPKQPLALAWYDKKANDRHMRAAQLQSARDFLAAVIKLSIEPRGVHSPLGKLMIMDAALDHGLTHALLKRTEINLGLDVISADGRYIKPNLPSIYEDEALYLQSFAQERLKERESQWSNLPGQMPQHLRARYTWFEQLASERDMNFAKQADGVLRLPYIQLELSVPAELLRWRGKRDERAEQAPLQQDRLRQLVYGSPVAANARAVLPSGWCSAVDHGEIYRQGKFKGQTHTGLDINRCDDADEGLPVCAVADGQVVFAGVGAGAWGNLVVIRHPDGMWSRYGHLKTIAAGIRKGTACSRGALLGTIGRGHQNQFNAHLHFDMCKTALWQNNPSWWSAGNPAEIEKHYVDPLVFIAQRGWWRL